MSWGYRITILYASFAILILSLVSICMRQTVELESKDYYAQELKYQDRINATNNEKDLSVSITHALVGKQLTLSIPKEQLATDFKGEIYFFRPSDSSKDITVKMQFDNTGNQTIELDKLQVGIYKVRLSWQSNSKKYFKESVINIH